jgi:Domain of unknown function (DUF927)
MARFTNLDARIERIEFGKTQQGEQFFKVIKLIRGRLREHWFALDNYEVARDEIVAALSVGDELSPESVWYLFGYVADTVGPKLSASTRPGLHEDCFVLPNGRVLGVVPWRVFLPTADGSPIGLIVAEGDVDEWQAIAEMAHGNPLLTMAIAFAVTGPVVALLGLDAPRIQLIGSRRPVMFAIEDVVAAMWRRSRIEDAGYVQSWAEPRGVLDRIAAERMHTVLVIDDGVLTNASVGTDLPSGHGGRLPNEGDRTPMEGAWGTPVFSVSTDVAAARARRHGAARGGLEDGLIDIALHDGRSYFEDLHGHPNEAEFLSTLNRLVRTHSGFMANFLIGVLCDVRDGDLVSTLCGHRYNYLSMARTRFAGKGDHAMRHEAFATIFAAGAGLLVDWENVSWELSDLAESLLVCEAAAINTANEGI